MLCFARYVEGTLVLCHFGPSRNLIRTEESPKSNHSRTYEALSRKSNYSRTYAKTGGWGSPNQMCSPPTLLFSSAVLISELRAIVGAPTIPFFARGLTDKEPASEGGHYKILPRALGRRVRGSTIVGTRRRTVSYTQAAQGVRCNETNRG